jgi:hypothetical protein
MSKRGMRIDGSEISKFSVLALRKHCQSSTNGCTVSGRLILGLSRMARSFAGKHITAVHLIWDSSDDPRIKVNPRFFGSHDEFAFSG